MDIKTIDTRLREQARKELTERLRLILNPLLELDAELKADLDNVNARPNSARLKVAEGKQLTLPQIAGIIAAEVLEKYGEDYAEAYIRRWLAQVADWKALGNALL